jgi:hypothetical protein
MHYVFRSWFFHDPFNEQVGIHHNFVRRIQSVFTLWRFFQRIQIRRQLELLIGIVQLYYDTFLLVNPHNNSVKLLLFDEGFVVIEVRHSN